MVFEALRPGYELMLPALALAFILDLLYPEHRGLLLKIHPVHTSYFMALRLGRPYSSKLRGVLIWVLVTLTHLAPYALALVIAYNASPLAWVIVASITLKFSFSLKLLVDICYKAYKGFSKSLDEARRWTQLIVRRDVSKLDEPRVVSATLESLAESLVDGFTSPLLYYALLGPLGALLQRVANTLDGALGFKTPEYREVGWFSAKMDTMLNYIPARITATLTITLAPLVDGSVKETWTTWRRWNRVTESLNAGHPMSAMAGALKVRLEKPGYYVINDNARNPEPSDIARGLRIAITLSILYLTLISVSITVIQMLSIPLNGFLTHISSASPGSSPPPLFQFH